MSGALMILRLSLVLCGCLAGFAVENVNTVTSPPVRTAVSSSAAIPSDEAPRPLLERQILPDCCAMGSLAGGVELSQFQARSSRTSWMSESLVDGSGCARLGRAPHGMPSLLDQRSGPLQI
ncbi:MAG: hypothetical protein KF861_15785 [Planctomycetaceae bacterium]|nr:hypothetical protein [Planctomycetaceae bacterium]